METLKKPSVLFCFSAFFFLLFTINQTMSKPNHMDTFCMKSTSNSTRNTTYNTNLNNLLSTLRKKSSVTNYYNLTTGLASDTVHGMFLCTGDSDRTACKACVKTATIEIAKNCTDHREAIIYYFECMVRYSDKYFLSTLETNPNSTSMSCNPIPKSFGKFGQILFDQMEEAIVRSSKLSSLRGAPYYLTDTSSYNDLYDLESTVQCTPHLDHKNCTKCLKLATQELTDCCNDKLWGLVSTPKCFVSFATSYTPTKYIITISSSFSIRGSRKTLGRTVFAVVASVFALVGL